MAEDFPTPQARAKAATEILQKRHPGELPVIGIDAILTDFCNVTDDFKGNVIASLPESFISRNTDGTISDYIIYAARFQGDGDADAYAVMVYTPANGKYGFIHSGDELLWSKDMENLILEHIRGLDGSSTHH